VSVRKHACYQGNTVPIAASGGSGMRKIVARTTRRIAGIKLASDAEHTSGSIIFDHPDDGMACRSARSPGRRKNRDGCAATLGGHAGAA